MKIIFKAFLSLAWLLIFASDFAYAWTPGTPAFHGPGKLEKATGLEFKMQNSTYEFEGDEFQHSYNSYAAHRVNLIDGFLMSFSLSALNNGKLEFEDSAAEYGAMIGLGTSFGVNYRLDIGEDIRLFPGISLQAILERYSEGNKKLTFFTRDYDLNVAASYHALGTIVPYGAIEGGRLEGKINSKNENGDFVAQTSSKQAYSVQFGSMCQFTKLTISLAASLGAQQGVIFNFYSTPENWVD